MNYFSFRILPLFLTLVTSANLFTNLNAKDHPIEILGKVVFESLKYQDFQKFYNQSVFSLQEPAFKSFLYNVKNQNIREHLIGLHRLPIPRDANTTQKKWDIVFAHNWREEWRHLAQNTPAMIKSESFSPLIAEAKDYGFQWETVRLEGVEVLIPVIWKNGRFEVKRDVDLGQDLEKSRTLHFDRNLKYRLRPDKSIYSKSFMIGKINEDSESLFKNGISGNGSGQGDITINFSSDSPTDLFYFCPDQKSAGGEIRVLDPKDLKKPNQRHNLLITMSYGKPLKFYQILLKEVLMVGDRALFFDRPEWLDEVERPQNL